MGSKSDTPPTPPYMQLAQQQSQAQQQLLQQQTVANRPNQYTPWGNLTWSQDPTSGQWTSQTQLNPTAAASLQGQQAGQLGAVQAGQNLFNTSGVGAGLNFSGAPQVQSGQYYDPKAQQAVWQQFQSMQQPLQQQQMQSQQAQLAGQGLRPGDPGYDSAMRNLGNAQYQQQQAAQSQSVLAGEQEAAQMQGMDVQAQNQYINAQTQQQMGNMNLFNAMMGNQVGQLQTPGFAPSGMAQAPQYLQAAEQMYGADLNSMNAQNAAAGNLWSGIGTIAGGAIGAMAGGPYGAILGSTIGGHL